ATTTTAKATTTTFKATTTATPVTTTTPTETAPVVTTFVEPAPLRGDVDGDGAVSIEDVQIALQAYTKRVSGKDMGLTDRQIKAADVNADGELSVDDVQNILIYYVNNTVARKVLTWDDILGVKTDITETQPASKEYGTLMQDYYTALMNTGNCGGESAASCDFDFTGLGKDIDLTFEWEDYKLTYRAIVGCDWIVYYFFDAEPKQGQDYAQFENDDPDSARVNKLFIKESKDNFSFVQIIPRLVKPEDTSLEDGVWHCVGMLINTSDDPGFHGKNAGMQIWFTENPSGDKSDEELISYDPIEFAPREFPLYPCAEVKLEPGLAENDEALKLYAEQKAWNEKHPLTRCANTPFGNFYFSEGEPEPDGLWYSSRMRGGVLTVCGVEPTLQYTSYYGDSGHDGQYNAFLFVLFEKPVNVPEAFSE
ncbi:MAG: hypothetical protein VZR73_14455, partial [Acutalibacteraceae bacterium]|nr:hypothetical protein [Acutalibacteraceae bacterium]